MTRRAKYVGTLVPSEHEEQLIFFNQLRVRLKKIPILGLAYAIPNGTRTSIRQGARMKSEGVKTGIPDIHFPVARRGFHSLYIELKARPYQHPETGRMIRQRLSATQKKWHKLLSDQGNKVVTCEGWEQALGVILTYLGTGDCRKILKLDKEEK